eukprot:superscaffoldBa00001603_g11263
MVSWQTGSSISLFEVLRCHPFNVHQLYPPRGWCLIGDGGYPFLAQPIYLMTPFFGPVQVAVEGSLCIGNEDILKPDKGGDGDDCDEANEPLQRPGDPLRSRLAAAVSAPNNQIQLAGVLNSCSGGETTAAGVGAMAEEMTFGGVIDGLCPTTSSMVSNHFQFAAVASPPSELTPV